MVPCDQDSEGPGQRQWDQPAASPALLSGLEAKKEKEQTWSGTSNSAVPTGQQGNRIGDWV